MLFLSLAIVASSSIALLFKYSETSNLNRYAVTTSNYATAFIIGLIIMLIRGHAGVFDFELATAYEHLMLTLESGGTGMRPDSSLLWAVIVGLISGNIFFLAFLFYQISVRNYGAGLAGAFTKLGILLPMTLSLVFWKEYPTTIQWLGIALAVTAIISANWPGKSKIARAIKPALLLLFLFGGLSEFANKVFQKYALTDFKEVFLFVNFLIAFIVSFMVTLRVKKTVKSKDLFIGFLVGVPNLFSSFFLIMALETMKAAVVFPVYGAGTILIINFVGITFFHERPSLKELIAILLIMISIVLINL